MSYVTQEQLHAAIAAATQHGSNANGNWLKFDDGTLVQWGKKTISIAISTADGVLFRSSGGGFTFTYPLPFVAVPDAMIPTPSSDVAARRTTTGESESIGSVIIWNSSSAGAANRTVGWIAIGRWK